MPNRAVETRGSHSDAHATGENSRLMELVANFRFQEQAKESIGQYVDELAEVMSLPSVDELPTTQKTAAEFAAMVEVDDPAFEKKLKVIRNGAETVVSTLVVDVSRDEIDFRNPKAGLSEKSFQSVLAILAEGAARFKAVAESDQLAGPLYAITRRTARQKSKQLLDEAAKLSFLSPKGLALTNKIGRALRSGVILLALSACGIMTIPPVVEADNTKSPTPTADEIVPPPDQEEPQPTQLPTPEPQPTEPPDSITALVSQSDYTLEQESNGWSLATQAAPGNSGSATTKILEVRDNREAGGQTVVIEIADGQSREYSAEMFEAVPSSALGIEEILTVKGENGEVEFFYLPSSEEWLAPIDIQTNPEDPNTYPEIAIEDVWSGKLVRSVELNTDEFPEGTLTPTGFIYELRPASVVRSMVLVPWVEGESDQYKDHGIQTGVNVNNDYRRWVSFTKSSFDSAFHGPDTEVIIATQQIKAPDGKSLFINHIFGPEWSWTEDHKLPNGDIVNLVDSVFLAQDPNNETDAERFLIEPVIDVGGDYRNFSYFIDPVSGKEVYTTGFEFHGTDTLADHPILPPDVFDEVRAYMLAHTLREGDFIWAELGDLEMLQTALIMADPRPLPQNYFGTAE